LVELAFATLANRGRALMNDANLPIAVRYKLFKEAFPTAMQLDGLMAIAVDGKVATRCKPVICATPPHLGRSRHGQDQGQSYSQDR
jgi:hypothetical protein